MADPDIGKTGAVRVLLVEDNPADARLLEETLKDASPVEFAFIRHSRLDSALNFLAQERVHVVLLDLGLPDASGLATLQKFNQAVSGTPVVVLTGLDDEELALQALGLGAQDYLIKGRYDPALLARTLRYAMARHRRAADNGEQAQAASARRYAGLPTRDTFNQWQRETLMDAERARRPFGMFLVSLERFRTITDLFGPRVGEILVQEAGRRIQEQIGEDGRLASLGGNDLGLILTSVMDREQASDMSQKLIGSLSRPYVIDEGELFLACSIGVAIFNPGRSGEPELLRRCDLALQKAKLAGGNSFHLYHEDLQHEAARALALDTGLRMALRRNEFVLYFQPCVGLGSRQVLGLEALVRWWHPEWGLVPPDEFIPAAEQSGLIRDIDEWVLRQACMYGQKLQAVLNHPVSMAVNLSAADFSTGHVAETVAAALKESGLDPGLLEIELTESALMKTPDLAIRALREMHALGVKLSVDDFGVGYSSLSYLRQLPVDSLKIDRSFIRDVGEGQPRATALVESIIALAKSLNLSVTAEGVETLAQFEWLRRQGCERGQGYLFSRPVPQPDVPSMERSFQALLAPDALAANGQIVTTPAVPSA